jgi:hypothetical protein
VRRLISEHHPKWVKAMDSPGGSHCSACGGVVRTLYRPWGVCDLDRMCCAECSIAQEQEEQT